MLHRFFILLVGTPSVPITTWRTRISRFNFDHHLTNKTCAMSKKIIPSNSYKSVVSNDTVFVTLIYYWWKWRSKFNHEKRGSTISIRNSRSWTTMMVFFVLQKNNNCNYQNREHIKKMKDVLYVDDAPAIDTRSILQ